MASFHHLWCVGLCWHRTQPEIGQLQGAHSQLLWKEALLQYEPRLALCWHQLQAVEVHIWDFRWRLPNTGAWIDLHCKNWDFVAGSSGAQEACHHFPCMPPWWPYLALCHEAETPGSQAVQLALPRFDHHPMCNCLGGAAVGIVGGQSFAPSAVLMPLLRHLQFPHLQAQQLIHQSLPKALLAWDWGKAPQIKMPEIKCNLLKYLEPKDCCLRIRDLRNIIYFRKTKSSPPSHHSKSSRNKGCNGTLPFPPGFDVQTFHLSVPICFRMRFPDLFWYGSLIIFISMVATTAPFLKIAGPETWDDSQTYHARHLSWAYAAGCFLSARYFERGHFIGVSWCLSFLSGQISMYTYMQYSVYSILYFLYFYSLLY